MNRAAARWRGRRTESRPRFISTVHLRIVAEQPQSKFHPHENSPCVHFLDDFFIHFSFGFIFPSFFLHFSFIFRLPALRYRPIIEANPNGREKEEDGGESKH